MRMRVFRSADACLRQRGTVAGRLRKAALRLAPLGIGVLALCPASGQETVAYSYDPLGRLVKVGHSGSVNATTSSCYTYDRADNRSNVTVLTTSDCAAAAPTFSIADGSVSEGGTVSFTVTRMGSQAGTNTVKYSTATGGTATSGSDYTAKAATTLTFGPGIQTQVATVSTLQDSVVEANETFLVNLSSPGTGTSIADGQATGTIIDDDVPKFSINDVSVSEGGVLTFTVTKANTTSSSVSVNFTTSPATALSGTDYTDASGTLTFAAADTTKTISVSTVGDSLVEGDETLYVNLTGATGGAVISDPQGIGTILDDDGGGGICPLSSQTTTSSSTGGTSSTIGSSSTPADSGTATDGGTATTTGTTTNSDPAPGSSGATMQPMQPICP